ncbi:LacI family DNA-binding transcriptional regulator [Extibacter sp. GGCC_0201]|uniref:LacI family DNA-binding transcriptional regulator n=1 Tax=Extibacter sp. GGCC_0201 TaxID=2731209 RepID=UPI001AA0D701|nr:LacI family DNA-binding transcriptional regulator [Extibacter sp. GGCC_0201]
MAVTIQQIAEQAGVSRGTVDRALNHRGRINPEVEKQICSIAEEMGYVKKERKKKQKKMKLGVVTQLAKSSFMLEVNRGIQQAKSELVGRGIEVIVKEGVSVNEEEQICAIDAIVKEGIQGLAVMPTDSGRLRGKLNELIEAKHIPVVTFNSDIVGTKRSCFVGMDNQKSGRTAAGLMGMLTGGIGKVLIITGFFCNTVNSYRVEGFVEEMKRSFPELEMVGVYGSFDDAGEVEKIIVNALTGIQGITGIFVASSGQKGILKAFEQLQLKRRPYIIIYDNTPINRKLLSDGVVDFLLDQEAYIQGYEPPFILANILREDRYPDKEYRYTDVNIKTKYNI